MNENSIFSVKYHLNINDVMEDSDEKIDNVPAKLLKFFAVFVGIVMLCFGSLLLMTESKWRFLCLIPIALSLYMAFPVFCTKKWFRNRTLKSLKQNELYQAEFYSSYWEYKTSDILWNWTYADVRKWEERNSVFMLVAGQEGASLNYLIPKRELGDQQDAFREWLRQKCPQ